LRPTVTLFTKSGCHLCEDVRAVIGSVAREADFRLHVRDIAASAVDWDVYGDAIPVVLVDGAEVGRYRLTAAELQSALSGKVHGRQGLASDFFTRPAGAGIVNDAPSAAAGGALAGVCVAVVAKVPEAGRVKTRLTPTLSPGQAAAVDAALLVHVVGRLSRLGAGDLTVCYDPPHAAAAMAEAVRAADVPCGFLPQADGDLGHRLAVARADVLIGLERAAPVLFVGVDSPDVPAEELWRAGALLTGGADVIVGPTDDGGYWCLGLSPRVDAGRLLAGIPWSSGGEFAATVAAAREMGYSVAEAGRWDDVDRPDDLRRLARRLTESEREEDRRLLTALWPALPEGLTT
jgi:hypothetical protein